MYSHLVIHCFSPSPPPLPPSSIPPPPLPPSSILSPSFLPHTHTHTFQLLDVVFLHLSISKISLKKCSTSTRLRIFRMQPTQFLPAGLVTLFSTSRSKILLMEHCEPTTLMNIYKLMLGRYVQLYSVHVQSVQLYIYLFTDACTYMYNNMYMVCSLTYYMYFARYMHAHSYTCTK